MTRREIAKKMAAAGIQGTLRGKGNDWEVVLTSEADVATFGEKVFAKPAVYQFDESAWCLRPSYVMTDLDAEFLHR